MFARLVSSTVARLAPSLLLQNQQLPSASKAFFSRISGRHDRWRPRKSRAGTSAATPPVSAVGSAAAAILAAATQRQQQHKPWELDMPPEQQQRQLLEAVADRQPCIIYHYPCPDGEAWLVGQCQGHRLDNPEVVIVLVCVCVWCAMHTHRLCYVCQGHFHAWHVAVQPLCVP